MPETQELDPSTNLPKEDDKESIPTQKKQPKGVDINTLRQASNITERESAGAPVQRTFGSYQGINVASDRNFNEIRAQDQSGFGLLAKGLVQSAGTVVGMGLESTGFLGDIPQAVHSMVTGSEMDWERNGLSNLGNWIEEKTKETFPIYQTEQAQSGEMSRFMDGSYWASHLPSIASTAALMAPGFAVGRGTAALSRLLGAGRRGQQIAATLGASLSSRHMESMLEGYESFEQIKDRALQEGYREDEANQIAGEQAAHTYRRGYSNLMLEMLQWGGIMKGVNFGSRNIKASIMEMGEQSGDDVLRAMAQTLKRNPNLTVKQAAKSSGIGWKGFIAESGLEGYEEFNQEFIKRLSSHNADVAMGLTDGSEKGFAEAYFGGMMGEHLQDPKAWDAAMMGFLGGAVFQGLGRVGARQWNKDLEAENARQLKSEQDKAQYIKDTLNNINIALTKGDDITAQKHREDLIFNLALNGLQRPNGEFKGSVVEGTMANTKEMFEAVGNMSNEELQTLGLDPETAKSEAQWAVGELNEIEQTVDSYFNSVTGTERDAEIAVTLANQKYKNRKNRKHQSDIESRIEQFYQEDEFVSGAMEGLSPEQQQLVRLKKELDAKKKILNDLQNAQGKETFGLAPFRGKILDKARNKSTTQLKQEIQELSQQIANLAPKRQRNKLVGDIEVEDVASAPDIPLNDSQVNDALEIAESIAGEDTKLEELYNNLEETKVEVIEGAEQLSILHQPDTQKEFVEYLSKSGEQLRQEAYRTLFRRQHDDGSYINKDGDIFKISYGEQGNISLRAVDKNLLPTGDTQSFNPEDIEEYLNVTPVDTDRFLEEYEVDALRDEFTKAIKEDRFEDAFNIINDELYRSNYTETASKAMETFQEEINKKIDSIESIQDLMDFRNRMVESLPEAAAVRVTTKIRDRAIELGEQYSAELDALDKAISKREQQFNEKVEELENTQQQIENLKEDLENFADDILSGLQEEGIQQLDRRTKPAQQIEAMEESVAQQIQELKEEQRVITNQANELEKDIKRLKKLKENLDQAEMPSVILNEDLQDTFNVIEGIRTKLMLRADITEEEANTLLERHEEAQEEINKAISAIENFRSYLNDIFGAGEIIREANNAAYQDLIDRGLLSGNESLFDGVSQQIFNQYRILFNKHLTNQLKQADRPLTQRERRFITENRMDAKDATELGVDFWSEINKDFPTNSDLFQAEDIQHINDAVDSLRLLSEFWKDAIMYQKLLKVMSREINRRKAAVEPEGKKKSKKEEYDIEQRDAPQRTIFTAFTRPAGSTGDNDNPSPIASQRRYGRFVNKTNFKTDQYNIRIVKPPEGFIDEQKLEKFGYDKDEVLVGIITDEEGNYLNEDGEIVNELNPDEIIYTTMPLATYETLSSEYGRTFTPDSYYLSKTYPDLKTEEARRKAYEADKKKELEKYEALRNSWLENIEENGFAEVGIIGKSLGVADNVADAGQYDKGATPNSLSDVFGDPYELEFEVNTSEFRDHYGEVVTVGKGFVQLTNPETGNTFEGAARRLNDTEVNTLLQLLRTHVRNSEIRDDGTVNTKGAYNIQDKNGNTLDKRVFEIFKDYIYSFDKKTGSPIRFSGRKQNIGGEILIQGQAFELFAKNPDGEGKIGQVNPDLIDALKEYLSDKFIQVSSSQTKNNESYEQVIYEDGGFTQKSYDSYKEYLIENNVVGTWRKSRDHMLVETDQGTIEQEEPYILANQQVIYDVPEIGTESSTEGLNNTADLPEGTSYITPVKDGAAGIWKVDKVIRENGITTTSYELINREELPEEYREEAEKISERQINKGISQGKFKLTQYDERTNKEREDEPSLAQIKQQSESRKKATSANRENLKDRLDNIEKETKEERKRSSNPILNKAKNRPQEHRVSNGRTANEKEVELIREKLENATGVPVRVLTTGQAIDLMENLRFQGYHSKDYAQNPDDLPYGMYHNGTAYVFGKENITPETLFHEVAHPIIDQIIDTNPYLFEQLKRDLANSREGNKIIGQVLRNYEGIFEAGDLNRRGWSEVIVTAIGRAAESKQLQQDKNIDSFLTKIFKAIREFFNNLFTSSVDTRNLDLDTTVEDLATMLVEGTQINVEASQATEYSRKDKGSVILEQSRMTIPGKNVKFTQDALNMINYMFFDKLFNDHQDQLHTLFTEEGNEGLRSQIMREIRDDLIDTATSFTDPDIVDIIDQYTEEELLQESEKIIDILENFDRVEELYTQHLQKYNVEAVTEETLETEIEKDTNKLWQDDHLIFSTKQNATSAIRFLIGSLTSSKMNDTFSTYPQNVDFGETFNIITNKLAGTTTLEEKRNILKDLQDQDGFSDLYNRLFKKDIEEMTEEDIGTAMYLLQFNEVFSKHFNKYSLVIKDAVNTFKVIDATINRGKNVILAEWQSNTFDKEETYEIEEGRLVYDQEYFNEKFPDKVIETEKGEKTIPYRIVQDMQLTDQQEEWVQQQKANKRNEYRNHYKTLNFLEELGVEFGSEAYHNPAGEEFNKRAQYILDSIKKGNTPDIYAQDSDARQNMEVIAQHEIDNSVDRVENQHLNPDGETVYNAVLNHYVSMVEDKINKVDNLADLQNELPHLFNTSYTENSILLNRKEKTGKIHNNLFDGDGNKATYDDRGTERSKELTVDITEGMKNNREAATFNDLTYTDKIHLAINSLVKDRYSLFRAGDKKLERYIPLEFFNATEVVDNGDHVSVMIEYLKDEIKFIREIAENPDQYSGTNNLVTTDGEVNYEFSILPNLLSQNDQIKNAIDEAIDTGDFSSFNTTEIRRRIESVINDYFSEKVQETKEFLENHMVIEKEGEMYKNNGLMGLTDNEGEGYNDSQVERILWKTLVNRSIANIEQTKLFTSHPAFYAKDTLEKSMDNFFHRMSGAAGTKKLSITGDYGNKLIEKFFPSDHRIYKYMDENNQLQETKEFSEGVKPIIRTAVFSDPIINSRYIPTVEKYLDDVSAYKGMEESDAMGLISLDGYRDMKIRAGEWNEPLERLYQWTIRPEGAESIEVRNWNTGEMEEVTVRDLKNNDGSRTVFTMLKPQYFGPMAEEGFIPGMYKLAVMPVLPQYTTETKDDGELKYPAMKELHDYMNENDVGLVTFESANKVGTKNPGQEVYKGEYITDKNTVFHYSSDNTDPREDFDNSRGLYTTSDRGSYENYGREFAFSIDANANIQDIVGIQEDYDIDLAAHEYASRGLQPYFFSENQIKDMRNDGIDVVIDDWGEKVILNPNVLIEEDRKSGIPNFSEVTTQDTWYDYWGLQLQTGNKIKDEVILGSQFMKQIISGIYDQGNAVTEKLGNLADKMGDVHNALIEAGKEELKEELGLVQQDDGSYTAESVGKLAVFLRDEAIERDANHNVLDGLAKLNEYLDAGLGLDILSNRDKIENILASIADKRVISQNVHGGGKVQAASTFFEGQSRVKAGDKWLSQEDLKFYEDGTMEVYMPHYFREFFEDKNIDNIEDQLLEAIGFRIPTSGRNVIENIEIKGFLPQDAGEVIVLPSEIVAKAGSDFDVDKLNVLLPNYEIVEGTPRYIRYLDSMEDANKLIQDISKELSDKTGRKPKKERVREELRNRGYGKLADNLGKKKMSILEMNNKEGLQNGLYAISSKIMTDKNLQKEKFTPIGTRTLEKQKSRIDNLRKAGETDPSFHKMLFDFNYYQQMTQRNIESISGTGLAALHTSDHIHSTRYNYLMTEDNTIELPHNQNKNGLVSLGGKYTADGKQEIGDVLNQITNMFIDGVKNPLSFGLNLNLETGSTALYLTRAGVPPKVLFSFLNQPAVRDYTHLKNINDSLPNQEGNIIAGDEGVNSKLSAKYGSTESATKITYTQLNRYLKPENQKGKAFKEFQRRVLNEYKKYEKSAQLLSDYVNSTRVDTVAMGKNTSQLDLMLRSLDKIAGGIDILNSDKLLKREENGFLAPHYKALQDFRVMFEPFFIHLKDSNAFDMYSEVIEFVDEKSISMEEKVKILDKFKNDYITYKVLNSQTTINGEPVNYMGSDISLFEGENSLPKRIMKIKKEGTDNLLLQRLLPVIGKDEVNGQMIDNLKLMDQRLDTFEQNALIEAWRDLFHTNEPLARDLVKFTFIQNGLQLSPMTFTKYIPAEIYSEVIGQAFSGNEKIESIHFLEKFVENNYNDENIIPTKWGKQTPSGGIYKVYQYKQGYNQANASEARDKGINPYEPVPNIIVKKDGFKIGKFTLFEGMKKTRRIKTRAIKDFRNNRALLSYGLQSEKTSESEEAPPSLTEEQIKAQMQQDNKHPRESINKNKECRGN